MMRKTKLLVATLFGICLFHAVFAVTPSHAGNNESTGQAIEEFITSGRAELGRTTDDDRLFAIFTFYEGRNFKPIWTRDNGPKTKGRKLLEALKAADEHGLNPDDYNLVMSAQ